MKPPAPLKDPQDAAEAERYVARLLSRRGYSRAELAERLARREADPAVLERVLDRAIEKGWIDEGRLARDFASAAVARGRGRVRVLRELVARGLAAHADAAWEQALAERGADAGDLLASEVARRVEGCGGRLDFRDFRRVYNALLRAGHDGEAVRAALESHRD